MVKELPIRNSFGNAADTFGLYALYCQAVISIAKNKAFNGKNIHICLRREVVKQLLKDEIISIDYVKSEVNLADPLTKPSRRKLILETLSGMRLKPIRD